MWITTELAGRDRSAFNAQQFKPFGPKAATTSTITQIGCASFAERYDRANGLTRSGSSGQSAKLMGKTRKKANVTTSVAASTDWVDNLSERTQKQIEAEELLRLRIRREIEEKERGMTPFTGKFFAVLNSAIGIWVLTAILLTLLPNQLAAYRSNLKKDEDNRKTAARLDAEIASRLHAFRAYIEMSGSTNLVDAISMLNHPEAVLPSSSTFPEYSSRSLASLLWELQFLVDTKERPTIERAFNYASSIGPIQKLLASSPPSNKSYTACEIWCCERVNEFLVMGRWKAIPIDVKLVTADSTHLSADSTNQQLTYTYDRIGNLLSMKRTNLPITEYRYDERGRITTLIYPEETLRGIRYDYDLSQTNR